LPWRGEDFIRSNLAGVKAMKIPAKEKAKILGGNAKKLLRSDERAGDRRGIERSRKGIRKVKRIDLKLILQRKRLSGAGARKDYPRCGRSGDQEPQVVVYRGYGGSLLAILFSTNSSTLRRTG
jgi:hypothetical protein